MSKPLSAQAVIYVHAKGHGQIEKHTVQKLLELGLPVCSRLQYEGLTQTKNGYDQPGLLITELAELFPGRPQIFLRAGLQPSRQLLDQLTTLLEHTNQLTALTMLSNASDRVNPFAGLKAPTSGLKSDPSELVKLLAPGQIHTLTAWTDHFVLLSAELVTHLSADLSQRELMHRLLAIGGTLEVPDHLFLHDKENRLFVPVRLQPHESAYPPPFGELSSRLQLWCNAGISDIPTKRRIIRPLHYISLTAGVEV